MTQSSRISHRIAFLTRDVSTRNIDLSHVRDINRVMASRNNFANDLRGHVVKERVSAAFGNMSR